MIVITTDFRYDQGRVTKLRTSDKAFFVTSAKKVGDEVYKLVVLTENMDPILREEYDNEERLDIAHESLLEVFEDYMGDRI